MRYDSLNNTQSHATHRHMRLNVVLLCCHMRLNVVLLHCYMRLNYVLLQEESDRHHKRRSRDNRPGGGGPAGGGSFEDRGDSKRRRIPEDNSEPAAMPVRCCCIAWPVLLLCLLLCIAFCCCFLTANWLSLLANRTSSSCAFPCTSSSYALSSTLVLTARRPYDDRNRGPPMRGGPMGRPGSPPFRGGQRGPGDFGGWNDNRGSAHSAYWSLQSPPLSCLLFCTLLLTSVLSWSALSCTLLHFILYLLCLVLSVPTAHCTRFTHCSKHSPHYL